MTGITMYDSATNSQYPPGGAAYAAYVDGGVGDQPNYAYVVATFPQAHHLSITVTGALAADAIDAEQGDPDAVSAADWVRRKLAAGHWRPVVYADLETPGYSMNDVLADIAAVGISRDQVRLWTAHYGAGEHICGPGSCGLLPVDADGTQWTSTAPGAAGGVVDVSLLRDDFFGQSPQWTEFDMAKLRVLKLGDADVPGTFWSVRRLQALLFQVGHILGLPDAVVAASGQFDADTDKAVRAIQKHYGIAQDGICGKDTWSVLLTGAN